jgi:hypothetical protein
MKNLRFLNDYYDKFKIESRTRREGIKRDPLAVTVFYQKEIEKKTFTPVFWHNDPDIRVIIDRISSKRKSLKTVGLYLVFKISTLRLGCYLLCGGGGGGRDRSGVLWGPLRTTTLSKIRNFIHFVLLNMCIIRPFYNVV